MTLRDVEKLIQKDRKSGNKTTIIDMDDISLVEIRKVRAKYNTRDQRTHNHEFIIISEKK